MQNPPNRDPWYFVCAALLCTFFLATSVYIATKRLFWYDEIFTISIAKLPDLGTVWRALADDSDSLPIGYHLFVRAAYALSNHADISGRVLSAIAIAGGMLVVFDCARRVTDGLHGLIAVSLTASSYITFYAYEMRSYALIFFIASAALWLWLYTDRNNLAAAAGFGGLTFLALTMHFYALLLIVPFGVWELYCWRPWRMPSPKFFAGAAGVMCGLLLSLAQIRSASHYSPFFWAPPGTTALLSIFTDMFPSGLFLLACLTILAAVFLKVSKPTPPMGDTEKLCWFFLFIPLAGFLVAVIATNAFYNRYFIATVPGIAIGFACLVFRQYATTRSISLLAFLLLTALALGQQMKTVRHPEQITIFGDQQTRTKEALAAENIIRSDGKKFIASDGLLPLEVQYYSKHPNLYVQLYNMDLPPFALLRYYPLIRFFNADALKRNASDTALLFPNPETIDDLERSGIHTSVRMRHPLVVYMNTQQ